MPTTGKLLEPILAGGVRSTHFFNGRVLTAEDLKAEQEANRLQRQLLARTVGEGILEGLEVSKQSGSVLAITPGVAVARSGRLIALQQSEAVHLEIAPEVSQQAGPGGFADCLQLKPVAGKVTGEGVYLLLAQPAAGFEGQAPMSGEQSGGVATSCGARYRVEGVAFRLMLYKAEADLPATPQLRNELAHAIFGSGQLALFGAKTAYGPIDQLRGQGAIQADEVPLALLRWKSGQVGWVDMWAVRRHVAPALSGHAWDTMVGPRRLAEAEAMFSQFQADLADYMAELQDNSPRLTERFRFLPPFGYLPDSPDLVTLLLQGIPWQDAYPDPAFLRWLMLKASVLEPIDLTKYQESDSAVLGITTVGSQFFFFRKARSNRQVARGNVR